MKKLSLFLLLLVCSVYAMAQDITVRGVVFDKTNNTPLIGAAIYTVEGHTGAVTDLDGLFSLKVKDGSLLKVSYIGYKPLEVNAVNTEMKIGLEPELEALDEVVVVGYGTMRKSDITGAVSKVGADDLAKIPTVDASRMLQGKAAGVNVQLNSGEPGAGTKIRIRGIGSINNSDPLYVVDGIQVSNISHIAPTNIQSIEILKDASATAIYGSRGSNGVVLIKTFTGTRSAKPTISVNIYGTVNKVVDQIELLNAHEYAVVRQEAINNAGNPISQVDQNMFDYVTENKLKGTNWQDEIFRTAWNQNYNVSVSGGSDRNTYNIGVTYSREEGVLKETFLNKLMANVNNEYSLTDNITLGANIYFTQYDKVGNNADYYTGPLVGALRADPISSAFDPYTQDFGEIYFAYGTNPARAVDENKYKSALGRDFVVNSYLQIDNIGIKGLSFRAQFGANMNYKTDKSYLPTFYVTPDQLRSQSSLYEQRGNQVDWTTTEYFTYNNVFGKNSVNATAGFEASEYKYSFLNVTAFDVPEDENLQYISASTNNDQYIAKGTQHKSTLVSAFARANYSYASRYLATATFRADGSSKFKKKWGYFPSFSLGWNISNESFITDKDTDITLLRLRGGWGQVGNQNAAGNNDYLSTMVNGYTYVFGGKPVDGAIQQKVANSDLSWETSEQYNIGTDFGFWNSKLTGTLDYYVRHTNDMILATPIPIYAGFWKPYTNAGSLSNKGFELTLNHANTVGEFEYNLGFNLSTVKNEVTDIGGGDPIEGGSVARVGNTTRTEVGHEIAYYYGLKTDGIFNTQEEIDAYVNENGELIQPAAEPGDVKFVDIDGDGKIDETTDRTKLGSAIPNVIYGFSAGLNYKWFDLNLALQGVHGNEIVNGMYYTLYSTDMSEWNVSKEMLNRWTPDNTESNIPRVHASDPNKNGRFSDRYVENGSYLRLSNLQIGYSLPDIALEKMRLTQFRIYLSANNLCTFTKYSGYDPEIAGSDLNAGVDIVTYPIPRSISLGCNIKF